MSINLSRKETIIHEVGGKKANGNAVGEADDDIPLQLKQGTMAAESMYNCS